MTRKWYAIYSEGEMTPSSIFADILEAKRYISSKKNSIIREIFVDSDLTPNEKFLITVFADFNPKRSNV